MIIRTHKNKNFSVIDNTGLRDKKLSWNAKGLLAYLLQLPDDWHIYVSELSKHSKNGKDSTARILNELIENNYVVRVQKRDKGQFKGYEYHVYESGVVPCPRNPDTDSSETDNPEPETPELLNTNNTKDLDKVNTNSTGLIILDKLFSDLSKDKIPTYIHDYGKSRKIIKEILNRYGAETTEKIIRGFFAGEIGASCCYAIQSLRKDTVINPILMGKTTWGYKPETEMERRKRLESEKQSQRGQ